MQSLNRTEPMTIRTHTLAAGAALALLAFAGAASAQTSPVAAGGPAFPEQEGKDIYAVICQSCHMPDGKGAHNTGGAIGYPSLAGNPKMAAKAYPALVVARGQKAMPSLGGLLNDTQIASVVNYIRTSFGNNYTDAITPAQVTPLRPARPATGVVRPPG
jgi:mono/diheme cytochrome c family protein